MANGGHGPAGPGADLERLARRYWAAWHDALQRTMPGAAGAHSGFGSPGAANGASDALRGIVEWWTRQGAPGHVGFDDRQAGVAGAAGDWLAQMQQLAARFAGQQDVAPDAVVADWRELLGGGAANPLGQMFGHTQGMGLEGWEAWAQRLAPLLAELQSGRDWTQLPTMGPTREHQARWQRLAQAFADYQRSQQGVHALLQQASQGAFAHFERRLRERDPAQPIESPRALFDLWIDAAEDAYAEVALSPPFRSAYADMVGGQMRLRQAVQGEIEHLCRQFDLPTRSELDGAHRKIADLERALRRLRERVEAVEAGQSRPRDATPAPHRSSGSTRGRATPAADALREPASKAPGPLSTGTSPRTAAKRQGASKPVTKRAPAPGTAAKRATPKRSPSTPPAATPSPRKAVTKQARTRTAAARSVPKTRSPAQAASAGAGPAAAKTTRSSGTRAPAVAESAVPKGTATAAATSRRDAVAGTRPRRSAGGNSAGAAGAHAPSRRGASGTPSRKPASKRAAPANAPASTRVDTLPNFGFVSQIPQAPEPMTAAKSGRRKR